MSLHVSVCTRLLQHLKGSGWTAITTACPSLVSFCTLTLRWSCFFCNQLTDDHYFVFDRSEPRLSVRARLCATQCIRHHGVRQTWVFGAAARRRARWPWARNAGECLAENDCRYQRSEELGIWRRHILDCGGGRWAGAHIQQNRRRKHPGAPNWLRLLV